MLNYREKFLTQSSELCSLAILTLQYQSLTRHMTNFRVIHLHQVYKQYRRLLESHYLSREDSKKFKYKCSVLM